MRTVSQPSYNLFSVCHKSRSLARYCFCCTLLRFLKSSRRLDWLVTVTLTIWLGTKQQLGKLSVTELSLLSARATFSSTVYDLGFLLDKHLTTKDHISVLCRSCFWQLRQLRLVRSSLTSDITMTLVHAFISSHLDYCNSLLYGVSDRLLKKLQAVHNASARVVMRTKQFDHITPVLRDLHWLPVHQRIKYKLAMIVYKCLHALAPTYLADDCLAISAIASDTHGHY